MGSYPTRLNVLVRERYIDWLTPTVRIVRVFRPSVFIGSKFIGFIGFKGRSQVIVGARRAGGSGRSKEGTWGYAYG
jgi:hypothetical protein